MAHRIIVVEDQSIVANDIKLRLEKLGYDVPAICLTGEDAIVKVQELKPDLILMDIMLESGIDGIEAAKRIRENIHVPVIFLTAYEDDETLNKAKEAAPSGYILKPYDERDLKTNIEIALSKHEMDVRLRESERKFRLLTEEIADAVIVVTDKRCLWINPAFTALSGYSESEVVGNLPEFFIEDNEKGIFNHRVLSCLQEKEIFPRFETALKTNAGRGIMVSFSVKKIIFDGNNAVLMVARDITSRKRLEADLRRLKEGLEDEIQRKDRELSDSRARLIYSEKLAAMGSLALGGEYREHSMTVKNALVSLRSLTSLNRDIEKPLSELEKGFAYMESVFGTFSILNDIVFMKPETVDIFDALLVTLDKYDLPAGLKISSDVQENLAYVSGSREKLVYVFETILAMIVNSIGRDGSIRVSAANKDEKVAISFFYDTQQKSEEFDFEADLRLSSAVLLIESHNGNLSAQCSQGSCEISVMLPAL